MYNNIVRISTQDLVKMLPLFFAVLIGLCIVVLVLYFCLKKKDNSKPLQTRRVKILEKPIQQGNVEWYVVECENGERLKLRSFQGNKIIITVGDVGTIEYRGKTIQSFQRNK